jgi:hypothetical protein
VALEKFYDCNISKEIIDKVIQKYNLLTYSWKTFNEKLKIDVDK